MLKSPRRVQCDPTRRDIDVRQLDSVTHERTVYAPILAVTVATMTHYRTRGKNYLRIPSTSHARRMVGAVIHSTIEY